jgi:hypothetical protein
MARIAASAQLETLPVLARKPGMTGKSEITPPHPRNFRFAYNPPGTPVLKPKASEATI